MFKRDQAKTQYHVRMVRRIFKKNRNNRKLDAFIAKYKIPREYLSVNRRSIFRGIWIGLFWGFIPMPFQMLGVLSLTPFLRFNVPIAITMVWLSNPVTMPFMYYMEYKTGLFLMGKEGLPDVQLTLQWFQDHWDDILVPLYVGTLPYSLLVAPLVAYLINWLWIHSVRRERAERK